MSLKRGNIPWNCNQITKMIEENKISFDNIVQRSYVWDKKRKTDIIESLLLKYPIPPIYAKRIDNNIYDILDGKQRLMSVCSYLNDEYALGSIKPLNGKDVGADEDKIYDITGKKYSELPEAIKWALKTSNFTIHYFEDITQEEEREVFRRLNAGKPFTTKEKNIANCKELESIIEMGGHNIFEEMYTKKSYEAKSYVPLIVKIYVMLTKEIKDVSFESKIFNQLMLDITISDEDQRYMQEIFDLIEYIHETIAGSGDTKKIAKKFYKETHLVSLIPFIKKALDEKYDEDIFTDWIMKFYESEEGASISEEYNNACLSGSAKPENIQKRHKALEENFNEYCSKIENYKKED